MGSRSPDYCDKQRLSIRERLTLFVDVCAGVQHAHQKGIIHRDIKPSNVLVTTQDEKHTPKIIDFGVAKATSQRLTERTVFTELGQLIGTPEYMSPEQAEMTNLDIDTRTDVYSLGVLLYELLAGERPFDSKALRRGGSRRDPADAPGRRAAAAQQPHQQPRGGVHGVGHQPARGSAGPDQGARRRPGLDHDEGAREGSRAALRNRPRAGARHRTPSQRRARAGGAAERPLSREEAAPPPSGPIPGGGSHRPRPGGRGDRHVVGAAAGDARRAAGRGQRCRGPSPDRHRRGGQRVSQRGSPGRRASVGRARTGQGRHDAGGARRRGRAHRGSLEDRRTIRRRAAGRGADTEHARRHLPANSGSMPPPNPK